MNNNIQKDCPSLPTQIDASLCTKITHRHTDLIQIQRTSWTGFALSFFFFMSIPFLLLICLYSLVRRNQIKELIADARFLDILQLMGTDSATETIKTKALFIRGHHSITLLPWKLLVSAVVIQASLAFLVVAVKNAS